MSDLGKKRVVDHIDYCRCGHSIRVYTERRFKLCVYCTPQAIKEERERLISAETGGQNGRAFTQLRPH